MNEDTGESTNEAATDSQPPALSEIEDASGIAALEAERDELKEHLIRLSAEFANYRKRVTAQLQSAGQLADEKLLSQLLSVLDDFDRAAEHSDHHAQLVSGIEMTRSRLDSVLRSHGLSTIDTQGPFDPHLHEAVLAQDSPEHESGSIIHVVQKGYRIGDKILRHAQVIVAH